MGMYGAYTGIYEAYTGLYGHTWCLYIWRIYLEDDALDRDQHVEKGVGVPLIYQQHHDPQPVGIA